MASRCPSTSRRYCGTKIGDKDGKPVFGFPRPEDARQSLWLQAPANPADQARDDAGRRAEGGRSTAYNVHDIAITRLVLEHLDAAIEMRRALGEQYGVNLTSRPDAKLAEMIVKTAYTAADERTDLAEWEQR